VLQRHDLNWAAQVHELIDSEKLDILILTKTWIPSDGPPAIKLDLAPPGYTFIHAHRPLTCKKRGGGVAIIHRDGLKVLISLYQ